MLVKGMASWPINCTAIIYLGLTLCPRPTISMSLPFSLSIQTANSYLIHPSCFTFLATARKTRLILYLKTAISLTASTIHISFSPPHFADIHSSFHPLSFHIWLDSFFISFASFPFIPFSSFILFFLLFSMSCTGCTTIHYVCILLQLP